MERLCEYCQKPYVPKRSDAMYCSQTCRQLSYVLRKAKSAALTGVSPLKQLEANDLSKKATAPAIKPVELLEPEIESSVHAAIETKTEPETSKTVKSTQTDTGSDDLKYLYPSIDKNTDVQRSVNLTDNVLSERSLKDKAHTSYPSILTDNKNKTESGLTVNTDKKTFTETGKNVPDKYMDQGSDFVIDLANIIEEREYEPRVRAIFNSSLISPYWISCRYRTLLECVLTLSETQTIELDDLKDVCNAFTALIRTRSFNALPPFYPYLNEIVQLRNTLKDLCMNASEEEPLRFRLKKETKQNLMASRWELANYVPKTSFNELSFKE